MLRSQQQHFVQCVCIPFSSCLVKWSKSITLSFSLHFCPIIFIIASATEIICCGIHAQTRAARQTSRQCLALSGHHMARCSPTSDLDTVNTCGTLPHCIPNIIKIKFQYKKFICILGFSSKERVINMAVKRRRIIIKVINNMIKYLSRSMPPIERRSHCKSHLHYLFPTVKQNYNKA